MAQIRDEYIRATFELSKSSPAAWATFVEAFKNYTMYELERMLTTPTSEAQVSLGLGRRMRDMRDDFIGIEELMKRVGK